MRIAPAWLDDTSVAGLREHVNPRVL